MRISRFTWEVSPPDVEFDVGSDRDLDAFARWLGNQKGRSKDR